MEPSAPQPAPSSVPPPSGPELPPTPSTGWQKFKRVLLGGPKDIQDPHLFHTLSLAAFLAWVGLGADGLSSSSYGPEEAFKNLGNHQYLAVFLALATGLTVLVISAAYTKIIEHFPFGGGGYIVTARLIGPRAGVVSVLDVRPADEFALGHLPGAVNIPLRELEARLAELDGAQEVVAYCRGPYCVLSYEAVAALRTPAGSRSADGRRCAEGSTGTAPRPGADALVRERLGGLVIGAGPSA